MFTGWAFMLICKLKLRKSLMKIFQSVSRSVLKLKLLEKKNFKVKKNVWVVGCSLSWASCWLKSSITWANWKVKVYIYCEKKMFKFQRKVLGVGYPVSWAPCCERTKSWVPCCERIKNYLRRWASRREWTKSWVPCNE